MLISEVRDRYGPGRLYRLWSPAQKKTSAECFVNRVALRWERIADVLAQDLLGRVRFPEEGVTPDSVLRVPPRTDDAAPAATEREDFDRPSSAGIERFPVEMPEARAPEVGALSDRPRQRQRTVARRGESDEVVARQVDRREPLESSALKIDPAFDFRLGPTTARPTSSELTAAPPPTVPNAEIAGPAAWLFGDPTVIGRLPERTGHAPPEAGREWRSDSPSIDPPPASHVSAAIEPMGRGPARGVTAVPDAAAPDWIELRWALERLRERSLRAWEPTEF